MSEASYRPSIALSPGERADQIRSTTYWLDADCSPAAKTRQQAGRDEQIGECTAAITSLVTRMNRALPVRLASLSVGVVAVGYAQLEMSLGVEVYPGNEAETKRQIVEKLKRTLENIERELSDENV